MASLVSDSRLEFLSGAVELPLSDDEIIHVDDISIADHPFDVPEPPPRPPAPRSSARVAYNTKITCRLSVPSHVIGVWDKLFEGACSADVYVVTEGNSYLPAHYNLLCMASPVFQSILHEAKINKGIRYFKILGVPPAAVYVFLRFLYSARYDAEEMHRFVLHLLVLSHVYAIPCLKTVCIEYIERSWLTKENVIYVLQLARNCDAPRLSLVCVRMVLKEFKSVSSTEGWKVMKRSDPSLEQELVEASIEADSRKQERMRKLAEAKTYSQVSAALEALMHICRDKMPKGCNSQCRYPACKGVEALLRHFSTCLKRVSNRCADCKRMWQRSPCAGI